MAHEDNGQAIKESPTVEEMYGAVRVNETTSRVELDMVDVDGGHALARKFSSEARVRRETVNGWTTMEFTGSTAKIHDLLVDHYQGADVSLEQVYSVKRLDETRSEVELDVTFVKGGYELAKMFGVEAFLITTDGPGGGNPVMKFTGEHEKIHQLLVKYED
jgi:hypothetical protein